MTPTHIPLEMNGRPVRLKTIAAYIPDKNNLIIEAVQRKIVRTINAYMFDGNWYSLKPTICIAMATKKKLLNQLRVRFSEAGATAQHITMTLSKAEGICFCWAYIAPKDIPFVVNAMLLDKEVQMRKHKLLRGKGKNRTLTAPTLT